MSNCAQHGPATGAAPAGASAANPNDPGVLNVADAALAGNDPQMALKVSQSVLASDPHNLQALYHEAAAYYAVGRCEDAIAAYRVALGIAPNSSQAQTGIGRCLLKRNAAEAESAFAAAVRDDPENAEALNDLGVARDLQGNYAGATAPYQQALLLEPGTVATEVDLGMSLALSGDGAQALEYLGPLAASPEATEKIREDYGAALVAAGRIDEARHVLAIDLPPDKVDALIAAFQRAIAASRSPASPAPAVAAPVAPVAMLPAAPVAAVPLASAPAAPIASAPGASPVELAPATAPTIAPAAATAPAVPAETLQAGTSPAMPQVVTPSSPPVPVPPPAASGNNGDTLLR